MADDRHDTAALGVMRRYLTGDQAVAMIRNRLGLAPDPNTRPSPVPQPGPATQAAQSRVSAFSRPVPVVVMGPKPLPVKVVDGGAGGDREKKEKEKDAETTRELLTRLFGTVMSPLQKLVAASDRGTSGQDLYDRTKNLLFVAIAPIVLPVFILLAAGLMRVSNALLGNLLPVLMQLYKVVGPGLVTAFEGLVIAVERMTRALDDFSKWVNRQTGVTEQQERAKEVEQRGKDRLKAEQDRLAQADAEGVTARAEQVDTHEAYRRHLRDQEAARNELLEPGTPERTAADRALAERRQRDEEEFRRRRAEVFAPPRQGETAKEIDPRLRVLEAKIAEPMRAAGIEPDFPNIERQHRDIAERARNENNPALRDLNERLDKLVPVYRDFFKPFGMAPDEVQKARHGILAEGQVPEVKAGEVLGVKPPPPKPGEPPRPRAGGAGRPDDIFKDIDAVIRAFEMQFGPRAAIGDIGASMIEQGTLAGLNQDAIQQQQLDMQRQIAEYIRKIYGEISGARNNKPPENPFPDQGQPR